MDGPPCVVARSAIAAPVAMVTLGWESELPLRSNQMWPYCAFGFPVSCPMPAGTGLDGRSIGRVLGLLLH